MQIDDLLIKLNSTGDDIDRIKEEKDQEIMILQESLDSTIKELADSRQVSGFCTQI
jgi:hypothetical protein